MNKKKTTLYVTQAAVIAAAYAAVTVLQNVILPGTASMAVQVRVSEALNVLTLLTPAAIPGLTIGCLIANLTTGCVIWDVIFGSLATLIGAMGTYLLRKHEFLCTLPPVIANMLIVPAVLIFAYKIPEVIYAGVNVTYLFTAVTVGIGEVITICVIGSILLKILKRYRNVLFPIAQK